MIIVVDNQIIQIININICHMSYYINTMMNKMYSMLT